MSDIYNMNNDITYLQVWFEGHVQGVGFRYKTLQIAKEFEVNGEVENLNDGRVYLQVEAKESEAIAFKSEIERLMTSFIKNSESQSSKRSAQLKGFIIR
jgi:acylphosphatase